MSSIATAAAADDPSTTESQPKPKPNKPDPLIRPTWLLEPRTDKEYRAAGLVHYEIPAEQAVRRFNTKSKGIYERNVTRIYRIRDIYDSEWLVWCENRRFKNKLGNYERLSVDYLGKYFKPIPLKKTQFNDQDEQEIVTKGTEEILTEFEIPFNADNLDDLMLDANRHTTEFYIRQEGKYTRKIEIFSEFRDMSFDALYSKASLPRHILEQQQQQQQQQQREQQAQAQAQAQAQSQSQSAQTESNTKKK